MVFRDIKQNYNLLIFNKEEFSIKHAKVTQVGFPRYDMNVKQNVVDINIECEGKTGAYSMPENATIAYANNLIISTDNESLSKEVESLVNDADRALATMDHYRMIKEKSPEILAQLNPAFREKREVDKRFKSMEDRFNKMESSFSNIEGLLKELVGEFKK